MQPPDPSTPPAGMPPFPASDPAPVQSAPVPDGARGVLALLRHRRSVPPLAMRSDPVPDSWLEAVLDAGRWAPTHGKTEPWQLVVFRGEAVRRLGEVRARSYLEAVPEESRKPGKVEKIRRVHEVVPVAIALGCAAGVSPKIPESEDRAAVACAAQNMMVAATALGLGSFWSTGALAYTESMRRHLGFEPPVEPMGFLFLGFPEKPWPTSQRRPLEEKVSYRDE